jgi:ABC-type multidrug transport system fused ATPase/permease subunit
MKDSSEIGRQPEGEAQGGGESAGDRIGARVGGATDVGIVDGVNIRDYRQEDLRKQFAVVTQEPILFSDTVAGNIAYGQADTDIEDLIEAAKTAEAHEFITRLPHGYDRKLGERGATLSGGERQRLSLARAFLNNAPFLILDEPTSALDLQTVRTTRQPVRNPRIMGAR